MSRSALAIAVGTLAAAGLGGAISHAAPDAPVRKTVKVMQPGPPGHPSGTECGLCHQTGGWSPARFPHERTGFPLEGAHADASCKNCHVRGLDAPLPRVCAECHADAHRGTL